MKHRTGAGGSCGHDTNRCSYPLSGSSTAATGWNASSIHSHSPEGTTNPGRKNLVILED